METGLHHVYVCGNDASAKAVVVDMLRSFGWSAEAVLDLGDITAARGVEMYLLLWIELMRHLGTAHFNVEVRRGGGRQGWRQGQRFRTSRERRYCPRGGG